MRRVFGYIWGTVAVLVLWWALGAAVDSPALPTPDATIPVLIDNAASITPDFFTSFWRILASMLIGTALGAPIGLILGACRELIVSLSLSSTSSIRSPRSYFCP